MDVRLALMTGSDFPVPSCQLTIHQPTVKEIGMIGEKDFFIGAQCLCLDKNLYIQDENLLSTTTNFQIVMMIMSERQEIEKKACILSVLQLLFPDYKPLVTPTAIALNKKDSNVIIDENNFEALQEVFKQVFCLSMSAQDGFNPANDAAKKIADKLMKARQRVAAQKSAENGNGSVLAQYISILAIGLQMPLDSLTNLTIYQVYDLMERYSL